MTTAIDENDNVYQRVSKILPADAIGAFLAIQAALSEFQPTQPETVAWIMISAIGIIAVILPFYAQKLLGIDNMLQRLFLSATFVLWSLWLSDIHLWNLLGSLNDILAPVIQVMVIIWTFLIAPIAASMAFKQQKGKPA
jgi:hypothetical protein